MPVVIEIAKNAILLEIQNKALEQGREQGKAEGKAEGMQTVLLELLQAKFGRLPRWAVARLSGGSIADLESWTRKTVTAQAIGDVLGPR